MDSNKSSAFTALDYFLTVLWALLPVVHLAVGNP